MCTRDHGCVLSDLRLRCLPRPGFLRDFHLAMWGGGADAEEHPEENSKKEI